MKMYKILILTCTLFCFSVSVLCAQQEEDKVQTDRERDKETQLEKITRTPFSTQNNQRFDFLFTRGFLINTNASDMDSVPVNAARSGTNTLAMGFNFPISPRVSIDVQPGIAFFRLYFEQRDEKRFPTDSGGYEYQKMRASYLELPVCIRINVGFTEKNEKRVPVSFIQLGGSAGLRVGSSYKFRFRDANEVQQTLKYHFVEGLEPLRYTVFGRFVYKSIGLNIMYRFNDIFTTKQGYGFTRNDITYRAPRTDPNSTRLFPKMSDIEFGITIMI
jgi:hypothetical protein